MVRLAGELFSCCYAEGKLGPKWSQMAVMVVMVVVVMVVMVMVTGVAPTYGSTWL